jgi:hypothetical protein
MNRGRLAALVAVAASMASAPVEVGAFPDYMGPRALGMGGAGRADARGDEGLLINPAGMSLGRAYTVEGGYQHISPDLGTLAHASVVDSTSSFNLAGGLFYTYRSAPLPGGGHSIGHEPGLALSFPFGEVVLVGISGKYVHVSGGAAELDGRDSHSGVTADIGVIVKAGSMLTIGVAGYNLHDLSTVQAPVGLGYGVAVSPTADLTIAVDGVHDFTTTDPSRGVTTTVGGGAEYIFQHRAAFRAGGGRDGLLGHGYVSAGLVGLSDLGAVDLGFRQDVSGDQKLTFLAVGLRLFVPQP